VGLLLGKGFLAGAAAAFSLLVLVAPAYPQQIALPPDLQKRVDKAIDDGILYLKSAQNVFGTWTIAQDHPLGYAALGGLTLLVCGMPADDPAVEKAANFVRARCPTADGTYEIALSILFLDKLGEVKKNQAPAEPGVAKKGSRAGTNTAKRDRNLIEILALRLIAGQSPTGGWTYKCPMLLGAQHAQLLKALRARKLNQAALGNLGNLPVLQDPAILMDPAKSIPIDPPEKRLTPIWGTTDNSNTQFAILAIWAARRHGLPVDRTLKLVVKRFETGQNQEGSWSYLYKYGGGLPERGGAMNCVGLLGLAIGNGMAIDPTLNDGRPDIKAAGIVGGPGLVALLVGLDGINKQLEFREAKRKGEKDQRVLKGFLAVGKYIGQPAGPLVDYYMLWSIERVAVLFNQPLVGQKDWYRWGAELLVANQTAGGNWKDGSYHGSTPPIDTCLALLFLKRANLVSDLTASLALNTANLAKDLGRSPPDGLEKKGTPPTAPSMLSQLFSAKAAPEPTPPISVEPTRPAPRTPAVKPVADSQRAEPPKREEGGNAMLFVILGLAALLLVGGGVLAYFLMRSREDDEDEEEDEPRKTKKNTGKTRPTSGSASEQRTKPRARSSDKK